MKKDVVWRQSHDVISFRNFLITAVDYLDRLPPSLDLTVEVDFLNSTCICKYNVIRRVN